MTAENILLTGASGLIGGALRRRLESRGCRVHPLSRDDSGAPFHYSADRGEIRLDPRIRLDAVVNLAGANISTRRWSSGYKRLIMDSRVELTRALANALAAAEHRPRVLLSASAIGFYGDTGADTVDESSPRGGDFLADVAANWEAACGPAVEAGIRAVNMRFGVVLSRNGGVLKAMLPPFKLGAGGKLGDGGQHMSWIALADVLDLIDLCLRDDNISGPINFVSGNPATNAEFTRALGKALRRPAFSPFLRAWLIRLLFGEMGEALLLGSNRVVSRQHGEIGFAPSHPNLVDALKAELG
ncbi:MAG: TIGR01777 family oxidoreductase [Gammaproteobacteria bacterium]|nr:TIGR01777 family oxidoreductase [Gammaproteobacteria bacterium]